MFNLHRLTVLSNEPKQTFIVSLDDNTKIPMTFEYRANQTGWFMGFEYEGSTYQNIRLTTSYNLFRGYRNWLPFGLRCDTLDGLEPMDLYDFSTGYASVYILNKTDIATTESTYYVKTSA